MWYIAAGVFWANMGGIARYLSAELPTFEIIFFRALLGNLVLVPWLIRLRLNPIPQRLRGVYTLRGGVEVAAMLCWFTALSLIPVADVVALGFTTPLFATLLAVLFLGERIRLRRGIAIAVGMGGAALIVRPGINELSFAALLAIGSAFFSAASRVSGRVLAPTENPAVIVAAIGLFTIPATLIPALTVWQWPEPTQWLWLCLMGGLATSGHICLTMALRTSEASELAPYDFSQLIAAVVFGILVFSEAPDMWTWTGAIVIASTAVYVVRREAQLHRLRAEAARSDRSGTG